MFAYSNENHFKFGFNKEPWREWEKVDDQFFVEYGRPTVHGPMSWRKANERAAMMMAEASPGKIAVCMSGGLDSQVVAHSFKDVGADFDLWHYRTGHPFETRVAKAFASSIGMELNVVDVNVREFFQGTHKRYETVPIIHGTYQLHLHLMDLLCSKGLVPVFGEGSLTRRLGTTWAVGEGHTYKTTSRHARAMGHHCFPVFFDYLPEQIHAYVRSPFLRQLAAHQVHNFSVNNGELVDLPSLFEGTTVHHVKYKLIAEEYPEISYVRKQVGHEHLGGESWYNYHLGKGKLHTDWKEYLKKHYLRFDMFEVNRLGDYFEGKCELADARVPYAPSVFWNYPE